MRDTIDVYIIYLVVIAVAAIIGIIRKGTGKGESKNDVKLSDVFLESSKRERFVSQMNDIAERNKKNYSGGQFLMGEFNIPVKTVSVNAQVAPLVEGFNEAAEIETIKKRMTEYIIATSAGNNHFEKLDRFCARSVIASAQFEANSAKLSYSNVNVVRVAFTRCEQQAQEISLFGLAYAEYNGFNGRTSTPFNATFSFKYSYVYRESTDRKSLKCPKCGAPVSEYEAKECEFCGAELGNMLMERSWAFTEITRTENRIKYTGA